MLEIIDGLENDFDVERIEGYGQDAERKRGPNLARPNVRLVARNREAAPIAVAFSRFPGLNVRLGQWFRKP